MNTQKQIELLEAFKKDAIENNNQLLADVIDDVIDQDYGYDDYTPFEYIESVYENGCASGLVESLIYYEDTAIFYEKHKAQINKQLVLLGCTLKGYFGKQWDASDPLALEVRNQNLLAWFAYESAIGQLYCDMERLIK